jgi:hypothetical protein
MLLKKNLSPISDNWRLFHSGVNRTQPTLGEVIWVILKMSGKL